MMQAEITTARRSTVVGIGVASALVPLNSTMVALALSDIARKFHIEKRHAAILVTVYLIAMLVLQPISGRISDVVGNKRAAIVSLVGFGVCSLAAALAPTFTLLIVARGVQAIFGSALAPSVQSMLRAVAPPNDRGRVFGMLGSIIGVGAAAGPLLGGVLVDAAGWPAIFLFNIPVVVLALVLLIRVTVPLATRVTPRSHTGTLTAERLWTRTYAAAVASQALSNLGLYSLLLVSPIVLDARGWSDRTQGLALSALTLGLILMGPSGGRLGDRAGRRRPVMIGQLVALMGVLLLVSFDADVLPVMLIAALALFGFGNGFASPSIMTAALESAPVELSGLAAGVLSMSRYVGSIAASLLLRRYVADDASGAQVMFVASAVALALGVAAASRLPSGNRRESINLHV